MWERALASVFEGISGVVNGDQPSFPDTEFTRQLLHRFESRPTVAAIVSTFDKLKLPLPESADESLDGTEGFMVFLDAFGVVLRIESKNATRAERVDDNARILRPLGSIDAGEVIIEICPGTHAGKSKPASNFLKKALKEEGVDFWDDGVPNIGHLPLATPEFPEGVPVVIDRLAVRRLTNAAKSIRPMLDIQEKIYGSLRLAFANAWPEGMDFPVAMTGFWEKCHDFRLAGKLVDGWNETVPAGKYSRVAKVQQAALRYGQRLAASMPV